MRYSVVTATLLRDDLIRTCRSVDGQRQKDWEHVIMIDRDPAKLAERESDILELIPRDPRRRILFCGQYHNDTGNSCRMNAERQARGEYVIYLDDDDYWADEDVLKTLDEVTGPWAVFPFSWPRSSKRSLPVPPKRHSIGPSMLIHKRGLAKWAKDDDWAMIKSLIDNYPYQVIDSRVLLVYDSTKQGVRPWPRESMLNRWAGHRPPGSYGGDAAFRKAAAFLGSGPIEDWGCGMKHAQPFFPNGYMGIDGTGDYADVVADLGEFHSQTQGILMRGVLEHNFHWRPILRNALASAKKLALCIFTPFAAETKIIAWGGGIEVPDISFRKETITAMLPSYREEIISSDTHYGRETIFYVECRPAEVH